MSVHEVAARLEQEVVALRHDLHQIPEPGLDLPQTQARLLKALDGLPLEISTGSSCTSVTAVLRGTSPDRPTSDAPVVLLRGDMDGLPVVEETGLAFASTNGHMHACGHDLHMSLVVGAAKVLCEMREELVGDVVFMFQPGEEGHDGAAHMIEEGVLDAAGRTPDAAYAIHVWSGLERHGVFCLKPGTIMSASDQLDVTVRGKGGHGSAPHNAKDPLPAACEMVLALQTMLTRDVDALDPAVITVGRFRCGEVRNVIADDATFSATIRSFSESTQRRLFERIPQLLEGIAAAHGVELEYDLEHQYPATVNDADENAFVGEVVRDLFGEDRVADWDRSLTASEDFSRVLQAAPGVFIGLAATAPGVDPADVPFNHSAKAMFDDGVLLDGVTLLAELALRRLSR